MADFRRWITALAVPVLFAGLASAQTGGTGQQAFVCTTNAGTPQVRTEGITELMGDIVLTCTGGNVIATGNAIPVANIVVNLSVPVTSRLLPNATPTVAASEALLLIDEPGSGQIAPVTGFGPQAPQVICNAPSGGATPTTNTPAGCGTQFAQVSGGLAVMSSSSTTATNGPNIFQGVITGANQVTFYGVPILPPVTSTNSRVFRITNIRGNANATGAGSSPIPITASISTNGTAAVPIPQATVTVGFAQTSLSTSVNSILAPVTNFPQCTSATLSAAGSLTFSELFATAFKTRVTPGSNTANAGQITPSPLPTPVPGAAVNSESGFILPVGGGTAGLADFGTRLKAVFNNIPSNVNVWVSLSNVTNSTTSATAPSPIGGTATTSYAQLVLGESLANGGSFPVQTSTVNGPGAVGGTVPVVQLQVVNGSATAVWEVTNANQGALDSLTFEVYTTYTAAPSATAAGAGTTTVNMSYAPVSTVTTATTGPIPRFVDTSGTGKSIFAINICRTNLLFPFLTNAAGFDTGIAISNTSADPFGTAAQTGTCTLNLYGTGVSGTTVNFPNTDSANTTISAGTTSAMVLSSAGPANFTGYGIAVCNFQYAHGLAFITLLGTKDLAMGYLPLVIPDPAKPRLAVDSATNPGTGERLQN